MILVGGFEIDCALQEDYNFESDVTQHPVEEGADVADHVRAQPLTVALQCLVSDSPVGDIARRRVIDVLERPTDTRLLVDDAYATLVAIRDAGEPVQIVTSLRSYDSMVMQSLQITRTARSGHALEFRATFVQVQILTNQRTTIRVKTPRAAHKKDLGNRASVDPTTAEAKRAASLEDYSGQSRVPRVLHPNEQALRNNNLTPVKKTYYPDSDPNTGRLGQGVEYTDWVPTDPKPPQSKLAPPASLTTSNAKALAGAR